MAVNKNTLTQCITVFFLLIFCKIRRAWWRMTRQWNTEQTGLCWLRQLVVINGVSGGNDVLIIEIKKDSTEVGMFVFDHFNAKT